MLLIFTFFSPVYGKGKLYKFYLWSYTFISTTYIFLCWCMLLFRKFTSWIYLLSHLKEILCVVLFDWNIKEYFSFSPLAILHRYSLCWFNFLCSIWLLSQKLKKYSCNFKHGPHTALTKSWQVSFLFIKVTKVIHVLKPSLQKLHILQMMTLFVTHT